MITVLIIHNEPALRLAARRVLESAGFAVHDAPDTVSAFPVVPQLIVADAASGNAIARRYPTARILELGERGSLQLPFTTSQLLAAVRLTLARGATREPRRRSASRPPPPA